MSQYWIQADNGDIFSLDSTSAVDFSDGGKLSEMVLESGVSVSDNYIDSNIVIKFSGFISSYKSNRSAANLSPQQYIEGLRALKSSKQPFTVYSISEILGLQNFLFESLNFTQDAKRGVTGGGVSVGVSLTMKQIRFASAARLSSIPKSEVDDIFTAEAKSSSSGTTFDKTEEETVKEFGMRQMIGSYNGEKVEGRRR